MNGMIPNLQKKILWSSLQNHLNPSSKCQSGMHMELELMNHCTCRCHSTQTSAGTMMTTKMNARPSKFIKLLMISIRLFFCSDVMLTKKGKWPKKWILGHLGFKWCYQLEPYSFHGKCCTYQKLLNRSMAPFSLIAHNRGTRYSIFSVS